MSVIMKTELHKLGQNFWIEQDIDLIQLLPYSL